MTENLVTWLLKQIAEDESQARAACLKGHRSWHNDIGPLGDYDVTDDANRQIVGELVNMSNQAEHIARWDPNRVLAECDTKRRIIEPHTPERPYAATVDLCAECGGENGRVAWPCRDLLILALPYSDRPDYREEWKP